MLINFVHLHRSFWISAAQQSSLTSFSLT